MMTEDEFGFGCTGDAEPLGADRDATLVAGFDAGALAPDEGPPRTAWDGPQHGTFFFLEVSQACWGFIWSSRWSSRWLR